MAVIVDSKDVEAVVASTLEKEGYKVSRCSKENGATGPDIEASRNQESLYVEAISFKEEPSKRSMDFYQAFFRAISRLDCGASRCVIALPQRYSEGLGQRSRQHEEAWKRIGKAFPELEIWLVDTLNSSI